MELGDVGLVAHIGGLVGQGATQLGLLGRDRDVPVDGHSISSCVRFDRQPSEAAVFVPPVALASQS